MGVRSRGMVGALAVAAAGAAIGIGASAGQGAGVVKDIALTPAGTYATGLGAGSAETSAVERGLMFVTNSGDNSLDIVDVRNPAAPRLVTRVDLSAYGAGPNSVDADGQYVAVAVEAAVKTDPGAVVLLRRDGTHVATARVGALPDMLTFTPDGRRIVVANEGEPSSYGKPDSVDPEGTVSIIDVRDLVRGRDAVRTVDFRDFNAGAKRHGELPAGIRLNGPGATVAQDLEPEYVSIDGKTAAVTLQEANAIAFIDLDRARVTRIAALGTVDRSTPGFGMDASDRDGGINIANWPVFGMPMPDAIASFRVKGATYHITANEGDARDYTGFVDEARVKSLKLDPVAFPDPSIRTDAKLGRLNVSTTDGVGPNGHTALFAFGTRSATIWNAAGERVADTGDMFERVTARLAPTAFNADNESAEFDNRSDNKGPEPEGVATGKVNGRTYAFVGLERIGGIMVLDVSEPTAPRFVQWANNRDYTKDAAPDSGPEIVRFVASSDSPTGRPMVSVANEISGTVTFYGVDRARR